MLIGGNVHEGQEHFGFQMPITHSALFLPIYI